MALGTLTALTFGSASTTSSPTVSVSPTAGAVVLVGIELQGSNTLTVSGLGAGATWVEIATDNYTDGVAWRASVWRATGTFVAGIITIVQNSGANTYRAWNVCEITGANTTTPVPGTNFIAGHVAPTATTLTLTLPAVFADAVNNMAVGFFSHRINEAFTAGSGFTVVQQTITASPTTVHAFETKLGQDLSVDISWPTNSRGAVGVAFELAAAASGAVALAATAAATSTLTGDLLVSHPLAGTIAAAATTTGALLAGKLLDATVAAVTTTTGALTVTHTLVAAVATVSTVTGALTVELVLAATVAMVATFTGDVTSGRLLDATVAMTTTTTGALLVDHPVAGSLAITATVTGALTTAPTAVVIPPIGTVTVSTERPGIALVESLRPYHVALSDERPYSVTLVSEVG